MPETIQKHLCIDYQVYTLWCKIGNNNALSSDTQIASFLIQCYQQNGADGSGSGSRCMNCSSPMVLLCLSCDHPPRQWQHHPYEEHQQPPSTVSDVISTTVSCCSGSKSSKIQETCNANIDKDSLSTDFFEDFKSIIPSTDDLKMTLSLSSEEEEGISKDAKSRSSAQRRKQNSTYSRLSQRVSHQLTAGLSDNCSSSMEVEGLEVEDTDSHITVDEDNMEPDQLPTAVEASKMGLQCDFEQKITASTIIVNGRKQYYCQDFDLIYPVRSRMRFHLKQHLDCYSHSCENCGATFFRRYQLHMHILNKHPDLAQGLFADFSEEKTAKENNGYEDESEEGDKNKNKGASEAFSEGRLTNRKEEKNLNYAKELIVEKGVKDSEITVNGRKEYSCIECGVKFDRRSRMKRHFQIHINYRPYACSECQASFHQKYHLQRHLRNTHSLEAITEQYVSRTQGGQPEKSKVKEEKIDEEVNSMEESMIVENGENSFSCKQCGQRYSQRCSLMRHIRTHNNDRRYSCKRCGGSFLRLAHLKLHVMRKHQFVRPFVCSLCSASFTDAYHLTRHEATHTRHQPFKCTECRAAFSNTRQLKNHLKTHPIDYDYEISEQGHSVKPLNTEKPLFSENYPETSKSDQITEQVDSGVVTSNSGAEDAEATCVDITDSILKSDPPVSLTCESSDMAMGSQASDASKDTDSHSSSKKQPESDLSWKMYAAVRSSKRKGKKPVKRSRRPVTFPEPDEMMASAFPSTDQQHICENKEDGAQVCKTCGPENDKAQLVRCEQPEPLEKPFVCKDCGQAFAHHSHLVKHARQHSGERPYVCSICGTAFMEPSHLKRHTRKHTGEKPFMCEQCGAVFVQSGELKTHIMAMHTHQRPYKCDQCPKAYTTSSLLRVHKRCHTGERPYVCSTCGAGFKIISHLKDHMLKHTGEKPKQCALCPAAYTRTSHLKRHISRAHPGCDPAQAIKS